jgi:hypothetical protein
MMKLNEFVFRMNIFLLGVLAGLAILKAVL